MIGTTVLLLTYARVATSERASALTLEHGLRRVMIDYGFMEQPGLPQDPPLALGDELGLDATCDFCVASHPSLRNHRQLRHGVRHLWRIHHYLRSINAEC